MRRALIMMLIGSLAAAACSSTDGRPLISLPSSPTAATTAPTATVPPPGTRPPATTPDSSVPPPATTSPGTPPARPAPGSAGVGDPYFPELGNGGYDVADYRLILTIDPIGNRIDGRVEIDATATQSLSSFNLDFEGLTITELTVDGRPAPYRQVGSELTVEPRQPLVRGAGFTVEVAYSGTPATDELPGGGDWGWVHRDDLVYVVAEPDSAHHWFPGSDHPSDKARFSFEITAPEPFTAIANGVLVSETATETGTTFHWVMDQPMATYLATVVVGDLRRVEHPGPEGIVVRDYLPERLAADPPAPFARVGEMISFLESQFGPYPFDAYGHVVVPGISGALENQTISIFGTSTLGPILETIVVHELAHQWFGDSVTPSTWRDIWLNEGFATYAEWMWTDHTRGRAAMTAEIEAAHRYMTFAPHSLAGDPGPDDLFGQSVYVRGGLTLHALRLHIGDDAFFDTLRTYAERYRFSNASTDDFISVAEEVAERDLGAFFDSWLFQEALPPLP